MRADNLKQISHLGMSERLRREVANAISQLEVSKAQGGNVTSHVTGLVAFLNDAAAKAQALAPATPAT